MAILFLLMAASSLFVVLNALRLARPTPVRAEPVEAPPRKQEHFDKLSANGFSANGCER